MSIAGDSDALKGQIAAALAKSGINQSEMARRVGSTQGTVGQWYRGESLPSAELLGLLAIELKMSAHWLVTGEGPVEAPDAQPAGGRREYEMGRQAGLQAARDAIDALARPEPDLAESSATNALRADRAGRGSRARGKGKRVG